MRQPSLKRQLLLWLLLPQLVLWTVGAGVTYHLVIKYTNESNDQALLSASRALSRQIKPMESGLYIDLPVAAQRILEEDPYDRLYYMVSSPPGQFLIGNRRLPLPTELPHVTAGPIFYDGKLQGEQLRLAANFVMVPHYPDNQWLLVQIGKSTTSRQQLAREIMLALMLPQSLLMLLTSFLVWMGISRGLLPLLRLKRAVDNRSEQDLRPIRIDTAPAEVYSLVAAVNHLLARLARQIDVQKQFIADAAHQLRTPLAGLKTQTELALREEDPVEQKKALQQLLISNERNIHLVNQLLSLAKSEPGSHELDLQKLNLVELAREVTSQFVHAAVQARMDLGFEGLVKEAHIMGHSVMLKELLSNLIDNAMHYCPPESSITVRVRLAGTQPVLEVEDNGPGIPVEAREKVFGRFYRLPTHSGDQRGCGLGLAIVKEVAIQHHAQVVLGAPSAHSGLVVTLSFPAATAT